MQEQSATGNFCMAKNVDQKGPSEEGLHRLSPPRILSREYSGGEELWRDDEWDNILRRVTLNRSYGLTLLMSYVFPSSDSYKLGRFLI